MNKLRRRTFHATCLVDAQATELGESIRRLRSNQALRDRVRDRNAAHVEPLALALSAREGGGEDRQAVRGVALVHLSEERSLELGAVQKVDHPRIAKAASGYRKDLVFASLDGRPGVAGDALHVLRRGDARQFRADAEGTDSAFLLDDADQPADLDEERIEVLDRELGVSVTGGSSQTRPTWRFVPMPGKRESIAERAARRRVTSRMKRAPGPPSGTSPSMGRLP
jgi:hypothetical protein